MTTKYIKDCSRDSSTDDTPLPDLIANQTNGLEMNPELCSKIMIVVYFGRRDYGEVSTLDGCNHH